MIELSNLFMYASGRIVLGAYRTPTAVGLYEGPVRAHNLLYALGGALAVPTVPTASRYVATGDERRLHELAVRGSRYTLALFVPLCVTLMALAEPILGVWLGDRYTGGATALTILVAYWLLYGALVVTPGFLVGAGRAPPGGPAHGGAGGVQPRAGARAHARARRGGPGARDHDPVRARLPADAPQRPAGHGVSVSELVRRAFAPAYVLGAVLAARCSRPARRSIRRSRDRGTAGGRRRGARLLGAVLRLVLDGVRATSCVRDLFSAARPTLRCW